MYLFVFNLIKYVFFFGWVFEPQSITATTARPEDKAPRKKAHPIF